MKIKEVCRLTGLSEKAVRYYIDCGLISPSEYEVRGRTYRDYDENDIEGLKNIIALRHLGLSIENISEIINDGEKIPQIMNEYMRNLSCEVEQKQKILSSLSSESFNDKTLITFIQ